MSASFRTELAHRLVCIAALAAPAVATSSMTGCVGGGCDNNEADAAVGGPVQVCVMKPDPSTVVTSVNGCATDWGDEQQEIFAAHPSFESQTSSFDILSGPVNQGDQCCYVVQPVHGRCIGGRPFLVDDRALLAPPRPGASSWSITESRLPHTGDLPAELRAALAEEWTQDGLAEHASVASFARVALELLAVGAPADLVEGAHRAALDEVRHARLCFSLAGAYAGAPIGPGAFPLADGVEVARDLASIAARVAREGCVGETIAAVLAAEQRDRATDPAVREVLAILAADEARHAELAWRTVAWAMRAGGEPVRAAVAAVLANLDGGEAPPGREGALDRHGRLDAPEQRRMAALAIAEVVRPAARVALGADVMAERLSSAEQAGA